MIIPSISTWLASTALPAAVALADKPGLPSLGDWAQAAAAFYAYLALRHMGLGERATFVIEPSSPRLTLLASNDHLSVSTPAEGTLSFKIVNAGPAPAIGVKMRCELLIDVPVEALVDVPAPTAFGASHGVNLCFIGSPNGVAMGPMIGGALASTHETYRTSARHIVRFASVQDKADVAAALPQDLLRAWLFGQARIDEQGLAMTVPLRVRVSWRTRRGRTLSSDHLFELTDRQIAKTGGGLVYDYAIAELDAEDLPQALREQNAPRAERARSVRYLDRARQRIDQFQGQAPPSLRRRARARIRRLFDHQDRTRTTSRRNRGSRAA